MSFSWNFLCATLCEFFSCFAAMAMAYFVSIGFGPIAAIAAALTMVALWGGLNGYMVGKLQLPDMVTTIGTGTAVFGLAYLFSGGKYIYRNFIESGIMGLNDGRAFDVIPYPVIIMFALYLAFWVLLHRTTHGRNFYAVGNKPVAARFSGINVALYISIAFVICAVLAGLSNMIQVSSQGKGEIKAGLTLLMPAWAAVFVGIAVFKKPTVHGTFLGAFMISIMQNGFTLMSVPFYFMDLVVSLTLILSITLANLDAVLSRPFKFFRKAKE
jgi:ribose/xylose/arabinose/galactoside ABC-type transport system permease subunit